MINLYKFILLVCSAPCLMMTSINCLAESFPEGDDTTIWVLHNKTVSQNKNIYNTAGKLPPGAPELSNRFKTVEFSGRYANYTKADTWYPTWASDGNLYSPWTDGTIGKMDFVWSGDGENAKTGYAKISGDDPLNLTVSNWGTIKASAEPYQGRYPSGSLLYNGIWYYGTYAIDQPNKTMRKHYGWYNMGPFAGFHWSNDFGKTWQMSPHSTEKPLFPEVSREQLDLVEGKKGPFIKMGAPHFVDFGKNMMHSPDGKAYLIAHGSEFNDNQPRVANNSWVTGDNIYLARVEPSPSNINNESKYEYFAGHQANGDAIWLDDFSKIKPMMSWNNHAGIVTATYNPVLKRYFMCVTDGHRGNTSRREYTSYIMESESITGPWKLVAHMPDFGPQAYFLTIPSKFISDDGKTMWLSYSANYMAEKKRNKPSYVKTTKPLGSAYSLSLHEFTIK